MSRRRTRADRLVPLARARSARPQVEMVEDRVLLATFTVSNTGDAGLGTLRQAILDANSTPNSPPGTADLINFNIFNTIGGVVQTIRPLSPLPTITEAVTIDGTSQPGFATFPIIELDGTSASLGTIADGLNITSGGSTVQGLVINHFAGNGIILSAGGGNTLLGNYIGTDVTGLVAAGNGLDGLFISNAPGNTIGGTAVGARNIISDNRSRGVGISGSGATGNLVLGNRIGTITGVGSSRGNGTHGVQLEGGAAANTIGGTTTGSGNVISGNGSSDFGISIKELGTNNNLVVGNLIGTDPSGTAASGNGNGVGISEGAQGNSIGGTTTAARNVISGNIDTGVLITGASANVVQGNYIGTTAAGTGTLAFVITTTTTAGVELNDGAQDNTIGGVGGAGNVISGNAGRGVLIQGRSTSATTAITNGNLVVGNFIGINASGTAAIPNGEEGVAVTDGAFANTIGGPLGFFNVISGNGGDGIAILGGTTTNNRVQGNVIGLSANAFPLPNLLGVRIGDGANNNTIGGTGAVVQNVISANLNEGVLIEDLGSNNNLVLGNFIGLSPSGTVGRGNGGAGVEIGAGVSDPSRFGPANNTILSNVIAANSIGIRIGGAGTDFNIVQANSIGVGADGVQPLGNSGSGVLIVLGSSNNTIGGTAAGASNLIANNSGAGVGIALGTGNSILANSIFSNSGLGIDLGLDGPTPNDPLDPDLGPNNLQNVPDLASATTTGGITATVGTLNSTPNSTFEIRIFANSTIDPSGFGEGRQFLGQTTVTTDPSGNAVIVATLPTPTLVGGFLTATATDPANNTSEFSSAVPVLVVVPVSFTVINTLDSGPGSLRQAILNANATLGQQTIDFAIPGPGPFSIAPTSPLPILDDSVIIDARTQRAFLGLPAGGLDPIVEVNGSGAGAGASGLDVVAGRSTVRGLVINRFAGSGILLRTNGGNTIEGNFLGTDLTGTADLGNGLDGVFIACVSGNTVGGTAAGARNLISGNDVDGVRIEGSGASGNLVAGNFLGTNATGAADLGNSSNGVAIVDAAGNTVGGTVAGTSNLIAGNDGDGIRIDGGAATGNVVAGNVIGTNAAGTAALANSFAGVDIVDAPGNTVGGTAAGARNVLSGNVTAGVRIFGGGARGNVVAGNLIGTEVTGTARLGNGTGVAILDAPGNTIGGAAAGARNVVSGNGEVGLFIDGPGATGNVVAGNFIGTDISGTADLGNRTDGVGISDAPGNLIGGTAPGAGNVISGNGNAQNQAAGVTIDGELATGNRVQGNRIGTDAAGTGALGNSFHGVFVSAPGNFIGGTESSAGNVISGNGLSQFEGEDGVGVYLFALGGNTVQGNLIGTDASGTRDLGNRKIGLLVNDSPGNTIGGTAPAARNVISGNGLIGLELAGPDATGNVVQGNFIGTDATGTQALANGIPGTESQRDGVGVFINNAPANRVGGAEAGARNVISGNLSVGVQFLGADATGNVVQGNFIGTDASGTVGLANRLDGVFLSNAPGNVIGGRQGMEGNVISGNGANGLHLSGTGTTGTVVQGNFIGLDASGRTALANGRFGLLLDSGTSGNTFDGPTAAEANLIGPNGAGPIRDVNLDQPDGAAQTGTSTLRNRLAARRRARLLVVKALLASRRRVRQANSPRHR